jgi:HAE1 family hydrophobic/amphiphilic exporter-1
VGFLKACTRHAVSVVMVYAGIIIFGITSLIRLNVEKLPDIVIPLAHVITEYPGIPAKEVEELVTIPLENVLSSVKGVKTLRSVTKKGISSVSLSFNWNTDSDIAAAEIREKVDSLFPYLPHGIKKPVVFTEDMSDEAVIILAVFPADDETPVEKISDIVQKDLKTRLLQIEGVSDIRMTGIDEYEIKVLVDPYKLYTSRLTLQAIIETIGSSVFEYPAGTLREKELEYPVRATTGITTLKDIEEIPLLASTGKTGLRIKDIAEVRLGVKEKTSFFHYNGRQAIGIFIKKTGNTGSLNVSNAVYERLNYIKELFKKDCIIRLIDDSAEEIRMSLLNLGLSITLGIAAAFIILFLFFKRLSIALITILPIPVAITASFLFMFGMRITLNIISLSGIAMGIGMIVDNTIVVLENLITHRAQTTDDIASRTLEMGSSTFGSTVTTLLVFLPILFIPGITGALFRECALTISFLLASSFIISLTLIPALYTLFIKKINHVPSGSLFFRLENKYESLLSFFIRRPLIPVFIFILLIVTGIVFFLGLRKEIMPETNTGKLHATFSYQKGIHTETSSSLTTSIETSLLTLPSVSSMYSEAGYERTSLKDRAAAGRSINTAKSVIFLSNEAGVDPTTPLSEVQHLLSLKGEFDYTVMFPGDIVKKMLGSADVLTLRLTGEHRTTLLQRAGEIISTIDAANLTTKWMCNTEKTMPEIQCELSRDALAYGNLNVAAVLETIKAAVKGVIAGQLRGEETELDIRVCYHEAYTDSLEKLSNIRLPAENGYVEAGSICTLKKVYSFGELYRVDRKDSVEISFLPLPGKEDELKEILTGLTSDTTTLTSASAMEQSTAEIGIVFALAVLLMYLILGAQFESFGIPLLLLISLPLSVTGSFFFLYITGKSLNINSFFGILILLGTTINTSIILAASLQRNIPEFHLIKKSMARLRPVSATVLTTVTALVPIACNPFREGMLQSHMAMALIGGLCTGTLATLLIFPVFYYLIFRSNKRKGAHV